MNYTKALVLTFCSLALCLLDTSFFSAMPLFGATVIGTFALALVLSVSKNQSVLLYYSISSVFFFSIFSSLPVWLIVIVLLLLPYILFFIRKKYFPQLSILSSIPFFMTGTLIFSGLLLVYNKEWSMDGLAVVVYFMLINSAIGTGLHYIFERWERDFGRKEIKF